MANALHQLFAEVQINLQDSLQWKWNHLDQSRIPMDGRKYKREPGYPNRENFNRYGAMRFPLF